MIIKAIIFIFSLIASLSESSYIAPGGCNQPYQARKEHCVFGTLTKRDLPVDKAEIQLRALDINSHFKRAGKTVTDRFGYFYLEAKWPENPRYEDDHPQSKGAWTYWRKLRLDNYGYFKWHEKVCTDLNYKLDFSLVTEGTEYNWQVYHRGHDDDY